MDNDLQELEAELKRLRPIAPSTFTVERIERALASRRRSFLAWAALPLAAALVGLIAFREKPGAARAVPGPLAPKSVATYKPVSADNVLYDRTDEGLVTLADGSTARRYRSSYVDTITWRDPRTQASLRWSVPRTEERVVPVRFQ
ncbi:MAG: hypothetical protein JWM32_2230 [Verrucomicrobia bacterium]|nr:hypothetical protein [Verrucomicrobiota bacterium]